MNGKVYLVGIGPGNPDSVTQKAVAVLNRVSTIIGHKTTMDFVSGFKRPGSPIDLLTGKEIIVEEASPTERAAIATEKALSGKNVAIVTTGDPGIYAIASTFFNYLKDNKIQIPVEVIPGVAAMNVAAGLLGSPLGGDFATVSLGDRATPWDGIKARLKSAAAAGFVVALFNPASRPGKRRLKEAVAILLSCKKPSTPVGIVTDAAGKAENVQITTLGEILKCPVKEQTILLIGNSETYVFAGKMVTPRKYVKGIGY